MENKGVNKRLKENLNLEVGFVIKLKELSNELYDRSKCVARTRVGAVMSVDNWDGWDGVNVSFKVLSINKYDIGDGLYNEADDVEILCIRQMNHSKRKMIKENAYQKAKIIVDRYKSQAHGLLEKGQKIRLTKVSGNSSILHIGDVLTVNDSPFEDDDDDRRNSPWVYASLNGKDFAIQKERGWDYDIIK